MLEGASLSENIITGTPSLNSTDLHTDIENDNRETHRRYLQKKEKGTIS